MLAPGLPGFQLPSERLRSTQFYHNSPCLATAGGAMANELLA